MGDALTCLDHLDRLEAESIHILREVAAEAERPVMLYSAGKDSTVMLHLARKAFYPGTPPWPLLHVDTTWKFREMYAFRDRAAAAARMDLIVHRNSDAARRGVDPFTHGALHTMLWKTEGLKQALDQHGFDVALGGARRDEEASRAKERIFSFRNAHHGWDPKRQRPELWHLYNTRKATGESLRVFPLSNWTEIDIWRYIRRHDLPVVDLYFASLRPTYHRNGELFVADDADRIEQVTGERPVIIERSVRFRTLGCFPLTSAIESTAATVDAIIDETLGSRQSERAGRTIDREGAGATMEAKKRDGYF